MKNTIEHMEYNVAFTLPNSTELLYLPSDAPEPADDENGNHVILAKRVKLVKGFYPHRLNKYGKYVRIKWGTVITPRRDIDLKNEIGWND